MKNLDLQLYLGSVFKIRKILFFLHSCGVFQTWPDPHRVSGLNLKQPTLSIKPQSMAEAAALFKTLLQDPENKLCFECGKVNPQWASVSFGVILWYVKYPRISLKIDTISLECAGGHRSLGVHLSFVRSLTMDSWTEKQLASMRSGGNAYVPHFPFFSDLLRRCKEFFKKYYMPDTTNLCEKYSSSIAQAYKAKIKGCLEIFSLKLTTLSSQRRSIFQ